MLRVVSSAQIGTKFVQKKKRDVSPILHIVQNSMYIVYCITVLEKYFVDVSQKTAFIAILRKLYLL